MKWNEGKTYSYVEGYCDCLTTVRKTINRALMTNGNSPEATLNVLNTIIAKLYHEHLKCEQMVDELDAQTEFENDDAIGFFNEMCEELSASKEIDLGNGMKLKIINIGGI